MSKPFSRAKKGYDADQVNAYMAGVEDTISKQKDRIAELTQQCGKAETELKAFRQKQDLIVKSIMSAIEKAEQIENLTRRKYQSDMAQLKAFHERWLAYYNKLIAKYPLDPELANLNAFNEDMARILTGKAPLPEQMSKAEAQFERENERLKRRGYFPEAESDKESSFLFNPEESIRELFRRQIAEEEQKRIRQQRAEAESQTDAKKPSKKGQKGGKTGTGKDAKDKKRSVAKPDKSDSGEAASLAAGQSDDDAHFDEESERFSYEEALNPKQELSDILRDLGLELGDSK